MSVTAQEVSVTLNGAGNWRDWYRIIEATADRLDIWEYVNPDSKEAAEPAEPQEPAYEEAKEGATKFIDLDSTERAYYTHLLNKYERERKEWIQKMDRIKALNLLIEKSLSVQIRTWGERKKNTREYLKELKDRYAPSIYEEKRQLEKEYDATFKTPPARQRQPKQLLDWVVRLQDVKRRCTEMGINRVTGDEQSPIRDLLEAIQPLNPYLYTLYTHQISRDEEVTFDEVIQDFKQGLSRDSRTSNQDDGLEATFATFKGDSNKANDSASSSNSRSGRRGKDPIPDSERCPLCLSKFIRHGPEKCRYAVPHLRPDNWKEFPPIMDHVRKVLALNPGLREAVDRANQTAQVPTSTSTPRALLTVSASFSAQRDYALKKSVIIDSATDVHVCNEYANRVNIRAAGPEQYLLVGDTRIKVEGLADYTVEAMTPDGQPVPLIIKDAHYVPGFHTNLVSLNLTRNSGVFYNQRLEILEESNGIPVCKVKIHHGMPTIQYIPLEEKDYAVFATRISMKERELAGSQSDWHNR